jgi:transcriptional regulator with XRE-family HTH domain
MDLSTTFEHGPAADPLGAMAASIKRERERAGLSLSELAKSAGVAKSTLSQLEAGVGNPSVETLWALAAALDVPVSRLIEAPRARVGVIRAGEGPSTRAERGNYVATLLAASPAHARRDIYRLRVQPGKPRVSKPHMPGTTEHLVLATGRARVGPVDAPVELFPGDFISYAGDVPHLFEALEPETTAVIVIEHA